MHRYISFALILIALSTLVVWAISQFIQPILPGTINSGLVLFFAALLSVVGVIGGFKDIVELIMLLFKSSNNGKEDQKSKELQTIHAGTNIGSAEKVIVHTASSHSHQATNHQTESDSVFHNLPHPDYGAFIGREKEIKQVVSILRPYPYSQHALVTIDGIGGIGKSALALEVAHRYLRKDEHIPAEECFEAMIWTSAKQDILTVDGIIPRQRAQRTLDSILSTMCAVLPQDDRANDERDHAGLVTRLLTKHRTLLIVDNLETIDDQSVMEFLRELPAPTKAIVTTRHRLDVAYPVRLVGMPEEDAQKLISHECEKKTVTLSDADIHRLYKRTGGVPLAIVWSVAQMAFGYSVDTVLKRLGRPNENISRFCFDEVMSHVRETEAYELLAALALADSGATRDELGYVTGLDEDIIGRDEYLVALEKLSLIQRTNGKFSLLPLVRQFVLEELSQYSDLEDRLVQRWAIPSSIFIDGSTYDVWVEGRKIALTAQEFKLLLYLYENPGRPCSRKEIIENVFYGDINDESEAQRVTASMVRLRWKIEPDRSRPKYLRTVRGVGYILNL